MNSNLECKVAVGCIHEQIRNFIIGIKSYSCFGFKTTGSYFTIIIIFCSIIIPFRRKYARSKHSFGIVVPLVSSVTGGPVPAYISAGSSKAVTVPVLTDAAFSP